MSTIRRALGRDKAGQWDEDRLKNILAEEFKKLLDPLTPSGKDSLLVEKMQALKLEMMGNDWLYKGVDRSTDGL